MKKQIQAFIEKLSSLPEVEQTQLITRWMAELESGDGAAKEPPRITSKKHTSLNKILGCYSDLPADLSTNSAFMDGFGK